MGAAIRLDDAAYFVLEIPALSLREEPIEVSQRAAVRRAWLDAKFFVENVEWNQVVAGDVGKGHPRAQAGQVIGHGAAAHIVKMPPGAHRAQAKEDDESHAKEQQRQCNPAPATVHAGRLRHWRHSRGASGRLCFGASGEARAGLILFGFLLQRGFVRHGLGSVFAGTFDKGSLRCNRARAGFQCAFCTAISLCRQNVPNLCRRNVEIVKMVCADARSAAGDASATPRGAGRRRVDGGALRAAAHRKGGELLQHAVAFTARAEDLLRVTAADELLEGRSALDAHVFEDRHGRGMGFLVRESGIGSRESKVGSRKS